MTQPLRFTHRFEPAAAPSEPTLLLLHGTGGTENDLLDLGRTLAPSAALLSPRGKVLERGMPRFFRRLAEGIFDEEDVRYRTHELADFVAAAAIQYGFDPAQVIAVGYSNGANVAASTLLLRPGTLAGAILLRPMVPLVPDPLPQLNGTRVLISAGQHDQIVAPAQSEALARLLEQAGAVVDLHWQPTSHGLTRADITLATAWLAH